MKNVILLCSRRVFCISDPYFSPWSTWKMLNNDEQYWSARKSRYVNPIFMKWSSFRLPTIFGNLTASLSLLISPQEKESFVKYRVKTVYSWCQKQLANNSESLFDHIIDISSQPYEKNTSSIRYDMHNSQSNYKAFSSLLFNSRPPVIQFPLTIMSRNSENISLEMKLSTSTTQLKWIFYVHQLIPPALTASHFKHSKTKKASSYERRATCSYVVRQRMHLIIFYPQHYIKTSITQRKGENKSGVVSQY